MWNLVYLLWACAGAAFPFLSRSGAFGYGRVSEFLFALSFTWVAIVGMAVMGFFVMDALSLAARLADALAGTTLGRFFAPRRCVPVTLALIVLAVSWSFFEAWNVRRVDLTLVTSKLPEGVDRLRVVHLTDIHLGGVYTTGRLARVMDIVRSAEPDILAMTGDLVDANMTGWEAEARMIAAHGAKYGAFAVPGNHEYYLGIEQALAFTKSAGLTVLRGEIAEADVGTGAGTGKIAVVGLDDPARFGRGILEPETLPEGLALPGDRFVLLLKHRPQVIEGTAGRFDLQLSGHTHGGQIWPFIHVVSRLNKSVQHLSFHGEKGESAVYVSNGAGFWGPPLRFLTPPEVTVIDLVRGKL
ncbi:MAG: metallophosphoesterase [Synergistaceae bacterium]|jgi:predicted MPP superfamily phosphohydrolase|nr:metallophosphoesterase [Synergistaceae bacterium]